MLAHTTLEGIHVTKRDHIAEILLCDSKILSLAIFPLRVEF